MYNFDFLNVTNTKNINNNKKNVFKLHNNKNNNNNSSKVLIVSYFGRIKQKSNCYL